METFKLWMSVPFVFFLAYFVVKIMHIFADMYECQMHIAACVVDLFYVKQIAKIVEIIPVVCTDQTSEHTAHEMKTRIDNGCDWLAVYWTCGRNVALNSMSFVRINESE